MYGIHPWPYSFNFPGLGFLKSPPPSYIRSAIRSSALWNVHETAGIWFCEWPCVRTASDTTLPLPFRIICMTRYEYLGPIFFRWTLREVSPLWESATTYDMLQTRWVINPSLWLVCDWEKKEKNINNFLTKAIIITIITVYQSLFTTTACESQSVRFFFFSLYYLN